MKIWRFSRIGSKKFRYFNSESQVLEMVSNMKDYAKNYEISVFELIETCNNAKEWKDSVVKNREREEGMKVILDGDKNIPIILEIKRRISEHNSRLSREVVQKFDSLGNSRESFKKIISDSYTKDFILYYSFHDIEWYKLLLQIHNFRFSMPKKIKESDVIKWEKMKLNFDSAKKFLKAK
jgi:hypothetical protein